MLHWLRLKGEWGGNYADNKNNIKRASKEKPLRVLETVHIKKVLFFFPVASSVNTSDGQFFFCFFFFFLEVHTALGEGDFELCTVVVVCCASTDLITSTVNERIIPWHVGRTNNGVSLSNETGERVERHPLSTVSPLRKSHSFEACHFCIHA